MSQDWTEQRLFDDAGAPAPHARAGDPESSELTVKSLGRDDSYNWRIFHAIMELSSRDELRRDMRGEDGIAVVHDKPVADDHILAWMERRFGRRYQRNVIARQRGLLREAGWIQPCNEGESAIAWVGDRAQLRLLHIPTSAGIHAWHQYATSTHYDRSST